MVILFDISYSMTEDNKIIFARTAITPVLKGLLPTDFVNVSQVLVFELYLNLPELLKRTELLQTTGRLFSNL